MNVFLRFLKGFNRQKVFFNIGIYVFMVSLIEGSFFGAFD